MNINEIKTIEDLRVWYDQEFIRISLMNLPTGYESKMIGYLDNQYTTLFNYILNK